MKCCNNRNGKCYLTDESGSIRFAKRCPFSKTAQQHCEMYAPKTFCKGASKVSSIEKRAAWADVAAKARAIVATGGVEIIEDNSEEIEAIVSSYQVAPEFPVYMGGPYDVILSKRSWDNQKNVGGWIQGYLCSCEWGNYNSGEPGPRWRGRFCAHAYATLLVANARARNEFTRNRMASMFVMGECSKCGSYGAEVNAVSGMCQSCHEDAMFDAIVAAYRNDLSEEHRHIINAATDEEMHDIFHEVEVTPIDPKTSMITWGEHKAVVSKAKPIDAVDCSETREAESEEEQWELDNEMWEMEGSKKEAYEYGSYNEQSEWRTYDEYGNLNDAINLYEAMQIYETEVDHSEYPEFSDWEWDAVRSGWMVRVAYEDGPFTQTIKTDAGDVYLEQVGGKWCLYPSEEFAENYDMDPDPTTGGPFEEFSASDPDEASVLAESLLTDDWCLEITGSQKKAMECLFTYRSPFDSQFPYPETYYSQGVGNTVEECLEDCMNTVQAIDPQAYDFQFVEEIEQPVLSSNRTAMIKDATRHFTYAEMQELEDEIIGTELHNTDRFEAHRSH